MNMFDDADVTLLLVEGSQLTEGRLRALHGTLDAEERHAAAQRNASRDVAGYVLAHGLLRNILADRLGCEPSVLAFTRGRNGKPELADKHAAGTHFNISHFRDTVAVLLAGGHCGVDICPAVVDIPWQSLTRNETVYLQRLPRTLRPNQFAAIWALKEAYLKATGAGLRTAPETVEVQMPEMREEKAGEAEPKVYQWGVLQSRFRLVLCGRADGCVAMALPFGSLHRVVDLNRNEYFLNKYLPMLD